MTKTFIFYPQGEDRLNVFKPARCGEVGCPNIAETWLGRCHQHRESDKCSGCGRPCIEMKFSSHGVCSAKCDADASAQEDEAQDD